MQQIMRDYGMAVFYCLIGSGFCGAFVWALSMMS